MNVTKGSLIPFYSEEAVQAMYDKFNDKTHYIKPDGSLAYGLSDDISDLVTLTLTK